MWTYCPGTYLMMKGLNFMAMHVVRRLMAWTNTGGALPNSESGKNWKTETRCPTTYCFAPYCNWGGFDKTEMSGKTFAHLYRPRVSYVLSHQIINQIFSFSWFPVNWHFNVLEMALETFHIVQGLSRTPLSFIPRSLTNIFFKKIGCTKWNYR